MRISKTGFRNQAYAIFRRIETTGEPVVITDRGEPSLVVRKYARRKTDARTRLRGSVLRYDDPFDPVATFDSDVIDRTFEPL